VGLGPLIWLPDWFWNVPYREERVPGSVARGNLRDGAHVGIWTGEAVAHLCQEVGRPTVWSQADLDARARYATRIGFKRPLRRAP
jgi:hypothetical protein